MPVYDYTYQTFKGVRRGPLLRWLAITKFALMDFLGRKLFVWLFTLAWIQFFLRLGYIYMRVNTEFLKTLNIPANALPDVGAFFFKNNIDVQILFCFLFTFLMGGGLISRDLRHSAMVLYMSKPISLWEYFLGKIMILLPLLMIITWFQTTVLFLIQAVIAPAHSEWRLYFWRDYAWIVWASLLYSAVASISLSLLILAASSLTKNSRYAGITFAVFIIGSSIVAPIVHGIIHRGMFISPFFAAIRLGNYIFRLDGGPPMSYGAAWAGILAVWAMSGLILKWRLSQAARYGA